MSSWMPRGRRSREGGCFARRDRRRGGARPPRLLECGAAIAALCLAAPASAFTIAFDAADFGLTPVLSNVQTFEFAIEVDGPLVPGVYDDPALVGVVYRVFGSLASTPSGFASFNLQRSIGGAEFYTQGSSLRFEIAASADLSDGLQVSELVGDAGVFVFDGREVGTGRYHPALFELNADGTGLLRNSNNMGGTNPASMQEVDVEIGEEYVTDVTFASTALRLAAPEPSTALLVGLGIALLGGLGIRRST